MTTRHARGERPGPPATPPSEDTLPFPVTFFVTAGQRRAILRRLRRVDPNRTRALLRALRVR
jgi:hypothetical protein